MLIAAWPWAATWILAFALAARKEGPSSGLAAASPALFWGALYGWTGDRRLFFPFAMQLAQVSFPIPVASAFFAVRILQGATPHILLVELFVAIAVLAIGRAVQHRDRPVRGTRTIASCIVSILALLALLL